MRKLLLLLTLVPMLAFFGCEEEKFGDLQGTLFDGNQTLAFADVLLYSNGKEFANTLTDIEGNFFMGELPIGNYKLQGLSNGMYTNPIEVSIKGDEITTIEVNFKQTLCVNGSVLEGPPVNPTIQPLENVKIEVMHSILKDVVQTFYTNQYGHFEVWDIEPGPYTIKIYHTTYAEVKINYNGVNVVEVQKVY